MKIKQLKSLLSKAGFTRLPKRGKGSHQVWQHQHARIKVVQSGKNSSSAKPYQIKALLKALDRVNHT